MDGLTLVIKKVKVGMMTEKERTDALQEVSITLNYNIHMLLHIMKRF